MALRPAESLIDAKACSIRVDLMGRFSRRHRNGHNSVTGACFDIGNVKRRAIERFERAGLTAASLRPKPPQGGNGLLMRLAPFAPRAMMQPV